MGMSAAHCQGIAVSGEWSPCVLYSDVLQHIRLCHFDQSEVTIQGF